MGEDHTLDEAFLRALIHEHKQERERLQQHLDEIQEIISKNEFAEKIMEVLKDR